MNDFNILEKQKELMFTPDETAQDIINWIIPQISPHDSILEAFKGNGAFYDKIPNSKKDYCEIDKGINFFFTIKK